MRIIVGLVGVLVIAFAVQVNAAAKNESRPNIVILFADDLGYGDLGSFGHPYIRTPNLDRLAAEGQRWTDFYAAAPVCSPSRAALLTGRYPLRTGEYGRQIRVYFPDEVGGLSHEELTLAEMLESVGYRSGIFGKWHLGDRPEAIPTRHGFMEWFGIPYSNDMDWEDGVDLERLIAMRVSGEEAAVAAITANRRALYADPVPGAWLVPLVHSQRQSDAYKDQVAERPADQTTLTKRYTEEAIRFMRESGEQPFFLYVPYTMPHTPLFRSPEFEGRSLGGRYGDVIEEIDWSAGEIVRTLEELDIVDNTLLIFTSDNGPWLTMLTEGGRAGLLRMGKGTTFEGGMRVPGIFSWPGRIQTGTVSGIGSTLDLYRTIAAVAGADGSRGVDGFDLSSVLFAGGQSPRNELAYYRAGELYAYRVGMWKLHLRTEGAYGQGPELVVHESPLLFHLGRDPSERFDIASEHADIVQMIRRKIKAHQAGLTVLAPSMDARLTTLNRPREG